MPPSLVSWPVSGILERIANRMMCTRCRKILRESGKSRMRSRKAYFRVSYSETILVTSEHLDSFRSDCGLCLLFRSVLSKEMIEQAKSFENDSRYQPAIADEGRKPCGISFRISIDELDGSVSQSLELHYCLYPVQKSSLRTALHLADSNERCFQGLPLPAKLSTLEDSTKSPVIFSLAKKWLAACIMYHSGCSKDKKLSSGRNSNSFLPTRVIDIGSGETLTPRLRDSVDIPGEKHYLTLSHCWGAHIPVRLMKENESTMKESITIDSLSQTFQDAFVVARELSVQYIWIDALCIIQDSEDDWQRESAQMCDVYSNSFCNIAATASKDGSGGLFRQRDICHAIQPLSVRVGDLAHKIVDSNLWKREIDGAPLNRRAWVCQERTMAPRTLHFASSQVFWECSESTLSESFPLGFPSCVDTATSIRGIYSNLKSIKSQRAHHPSSEEGSQSTRQEVGLFGMWIAIVELYTRRELTYETDKLIAIGGIAAEIDRSLKVGYFAGLWRSHFTRQLLWQCNGFASRPEKYIAPTWSWASIHGSVTYSWDLWPAGFDLPAQQDLVNVKGINVELEGANVFGQVKGGAVCLEGKLFRLRSDSNASKMATGVYFTQTEAGCSIKVVLDTVRSTETPVELDHLYCLPVQSVLAFGRKMVLLTRGLLLGCTGATGEFQRCGTFSEHGFSTTDGIQAALRRFDESAEESGLEYSEDSNGGYNYLVKVI